MQSDFPNYFVSACLVAENQNTDSLYHKPWFQEQIYKHGMIETGKFSPFPPPTAFVLLPFTGFDSMTAKRIWLIFNVLLIIPIILLMKRISGLSVSGSAIIFLLTGIALVNNLVLGQLYLVILFLLFSGYFFLLKGYAGSTGIVLGTGIAAKYFPLVFIPTLVIEQRWKSLLSTGIVFLLINLLSVAVLGKQVYLDFFRSVLFQHLDGNLEGQSPWSASFQSWNSLGHRLFLPDKFENPNPVVESVALFYVFKYGILICTITASAWLFYKYKHQPDFVEGSLSLISITMLMLSPAGATYHGLLLLFPVTLMGTVLLGREKLRGWLVQLSILGLIGFLPPVLEKMNLSTVNLLFIYQRLVLYLAMYFTVYFQLLSIYRHQPVNPIKVKSPEPGMATPS